MHLASGNAISRMPPGAAVVTVSSLESVSVKGLNTAKSEGVVVHDDLAVIGALDTDRWVFVSFFSFSLFGFLFYPFGFSVRRRA